ncbi:MAG: hypothetical protein D6815_00965 [Candidatus Dadabacteria bacterium]|nr:MAG: hypothetical protein D6815_00965 [Candidatus Dadabacteria bacterium]
MIAPAPLFAGIAREPEYSPGKIEADRAILEATAAALADRGVRVCLFTAAREAAEVGAELYFAMCQGPAALAELTRIGARGRPVVHDASTIRACRRIETAVRLERAGIALARRRPVDTREPSREVLARWFATCGRGVWVKRGDVHATEPGDVVRVETPGEALAVLAGFRRRGIRHALLEEHVEGSTIKFYGVRGVGFFRAYDESGASISGSQADGWPGLAEKAAAALGLEVFGGDLIVTPSGELVLVDLNDWPSFAPCRDGAARAIADRLLVRWRQAGGRM